jgi:hypothetical protein
MMENAKAAGLGEGVVMTDWQAVSGRRIDLSGGNKETLTSSSLELSPRRSHPRDREHQAGRPAYSHGLG